MPKKKEITARERKFYDQGCKAGVKSQAKLILSAGANGHVAGEAKGYAEGKKVGLKQGKEAGLKEGRRLGFNKGYTAGEQEAYPVSYNKGASDTRKLFVAAIETKMSIADGYTDVEKWREDFKIPSWWIACLMSLWEPSYKHPDEEREVEEVVESDST